MAHRPERLRAAHDACETVRARRIAIGVDGERPAGRGLPVLDAVSDAVVIRGARAPRPVRVLQPVGRGVPVAGVVGRRDVVPHVGEVHAVRARVRAVDEARRPVVEAQHVQLVVLGVGVPDVEPVAEAHRLHEPRHRLVDDARGERDGRRGGVLLRRHRRDATRRVAHEADDAARGVGDLREVVGGVVGVGDGLGGAGAGQRAGVRDDVAAHVVGERQRAALVRHRREPALALVAVQHRVVGGGDVLGRGGGVGAGQDAAGVVVGHVGDGAAPVGRLGDEPAQVAHVHGGAAVGRGLLDHFAETVADARLTAIGTSPDYPLDRISGAKLGTSQA